MSRFRIVTLATMLVALFSGNAEGGILLFTKEISVNRSVNIFDTNQFDLHLGFGNKFTSPTNGVTLFDGLIISPANVGQTFTADPSDADFAQVAQRLTDGSNEFIKVMLKENQVGGLSEQRGWQESFFFGHVAPLTPPDLLGEEVKGITLHISKFNIATTPPPGGPAALLSAPPGPQFDLVFTLQLFGVPEPTSLLLGLSGLALGLRRARFV